MKLSNSWTSVIESMIVMLIVTIWIVWTYTIYTNSMKISDSTSYRIQAISIAKDGIESITNIRDTNWILFWANIDNCWNTYNYNWACITADWTPSYEYTYISTWSYIVYKDIDDRFILSWATNLISSLNYKDLNYRNYFKVQKDILWFYTQSWGTSFLPTFTREIKISYPDNLNPPQSMKVESIVRWADSSKPSWNYEIKLENTLTNWKK